MIRALGLAAGDLLRPALLGLVLRVIGLTILVLLALQGAATLAIRAFAPAVVHLPWLGAVPLRELAGWGSLALLPVMALFLMAPVAAGICGMMGDAVAGRVEAIHYPRNPGRDLGLRAGLGESLGVLLAVLAVGLLVLVATPILGPLAPLVFYGANGWLLGREFFQAAAVRHLPRPEAAALRRAHAGRVTATGIAVALLLTVPVLNLLVPMLAMAAFTHLYQIIAGSTGPMSAHRPA